MQSLKYRNNSIASLELKSDRFFSDSASSSSFFFLRYVFAMLKGISFWIFCPTAGRNPFLAGLKNIKIMKVPVFSIVWYTFLREGASPMARGNAVNE